MLAFALLATFAIAVPQWQPRVVQPYDVASASGKLVLHVEARESNGHGPMQCRLARGAETVWSQELPWAFESAAVADDGSVVGYANSRGVHIVVLDPQGAVRKEHVLPYEVFAPDMDPFPRAVGPVLIHPLADLALIRILPGEWSRPFPWRTFRISTGEYAGETRPAKPAPKSEQGWTAQRDELVVGDTGLTLCRWLFVDEKPPDVSWRRVGGIFTLVDLHGETVWSLEWLDDYTGRASDRPGDSLEERVEKRSPLLGTGPGNRFALWQARPNERVEFSVERDASAPKGWKVTEVARSPMGELPGEPKTVEVIELKDLGAVCLDWILDPRIPPIRDVLELGFTDDGRLEFLRSYTKGFDWQRDDPLSYARLRDDGQLELERDFRGVVARGGVTSSCFDLLGDRWLLGLHTGNRIWVEVDMRTLVSRPSPIPPEAVSVHASPTADGGYVALVEASRPDGKTAKSLVKVLGDGAIAWRSDADGDPRDDGELEAAIRKGEDVACLPEGKLALLGELDLTVFDSERRLVRATALADVLGHSATFSTWLLSDRRGGVWFHEGERFWRVDEQGRPAGTLVPMRGDGTHEPILDRELRSAPDGRLWTTDGTRIYRLGESGIADLELGQKVEVARLVQPAECSIDALGRVLIRDRFTQALHAFDADGKPLFVAEVSPAERFDKPPVATLRPNADGTLWMRVLTGPIKIDAGGVRISLPDLEASAVLALQYWRELDRSREEIRSIGRIERRPDGKWIVEKAGHAVLLDGRHAVAEAQGNEPCPRLHLYTAANEPLASIDLPENAPCDRILATPRWLVIGDRGPVWTLVRLEDSRAFRFTPPGSLGPWEIGATPDGRRLLFLDRSGRSLARYELP